MAVQKPDFHYLYLGPGVNVAYLFTAAHKYIVQFRPILIDSLDTVQYTPPRRKVAITSLARRDTAKLVRDTIAKRFPRAYHDALVYDFLEEMQMTLDGRAAVGQRLGIPETDS